MDEMLDLVGASFYFVIKRQFHISLLQVRQQLLGTASSITLPEDLLASIDQHAGSFDNNRSAFIEAAVRALIAQMERGMRYARDMEIINREVDRLNREAEEVLSFQGIP